MNPEDLSALRLTRGPCPPAETLLEYQALSERDRAHHAAHDHIVICSRCQLVLLHSDAPAAAMTANFRWALPLAAVLILGVATSLVFRNVAASLPHEADPVRGTEIQLVAPQGSVDTISEFSWQSSLRAVRYRVKVMRGSDQVWSAETDATKIAAPIGVLDANVEYRWMVEALDRAGDVRMTSPAQSFISSRRR